MMELKIILILYIHLRKFRNMAAQLYKLLPQWKPAWKLGKSFKALSLDVQIVSI